MILTAAESSRIRAEAYKTILSGGANLDVDVVAEIVATADFPGFNAQSVRVMQMEAILVPGTGWRVVDACRPQGDEQSESTFILPEDLPAFEVQQHLACVHAYLHDEFIRAPGTIRPPGQGAPPAFEM